MAGDPSVTLRLHHIGMLVDNIEAERRTYEARFGYAACGDVVHDPVQTAFVQFFRLPQDDVFLEFVSPDSPESKLSGALNKGVRLHHLCYVTDSIEESCGELRSKGMTLVQAPVSAPAFPGRRIAWLMGRDRVLVELVEEGTEKGLP
jgi:methylmalonyl-CoA/ethylmalonyl-CoA epimerase